MAIPDAEISAVRFLLCVVVERYILQQKCPKKCNTIVYNFQPRTPTLSAQCTALQTGRQIMLPRADHTAQGGGGDTTMEGPKVPSEARRAGAPRGVGLAPVQYGDLGA